MARGVDALTPGDRAPAVSLARRAQRHEQHPGERTGRATQPLRDGGATGAANAARKVARCSVMRRWLVLVRERTSRRPTWAGRRPVRRRYAAAARRLFVANLPIRRCTSARTVFTSMTNSVLVGGCQARMSIGPTPATPRSNSASTSHPASPRRRISASTSEAWSRSSNRSSSPPRHCASTTIRTPSAEAIARNTRTVKPSRSPRSSSETVCWATPAAVATSDWRFPWRMRTARRAAPRRWSRSTGSEWRPALHPHITGTHQRLRRGGQAAKRRLGDPPRHGAAAPVPQLRPAVVVGPGAGPLAVARGGSHARRVGPTPSPRPRPSPSTPGGRRRRGGRAAGERRASGGRAGHRPDAANAARPRSEPAAGSTHPSSRASTYTSSRASSRSRPLSTSSLRGRPLPP